MPMHILASATRQERHEGQSNSVGRKRKHHSKDIKESNQTRLVRHKAMVGMIRDNANWKRSYEQTGRWTDNEISFSSTPGCQLVDSSIILEALIEGFQLMKAEGRRLWLGGNSTMGFLIGPFRFFTDFTSATSSSDGCESTVPFIFLLNSESNEFIKSSVENLVPNPSESEGEHECDVPACEVFTTFSNILFDADYDFYPVDDQSFFDEDIPKKIYLNPLFDEEIISMKIDPHHFNAESDLIDSLLNQIDLSFTPNDPMPPGIEEDDYDSKRDILILEELLSNYSLSLPKNESFHFDIPSFSRPPAKPPDDLCSPNPLSPFPILVEDSDSLMEEIDLSFTLDDQMPPGIKEDDYDSERDIFILEEFLSNDFLSLPENESFHFDIPSPSRPPAKPPDGVFGLRQK
nr:hypothetical protein [Tanacetum cinerariifolium]